MNPLIIFLSVLFVSSTTHGSNHHHHRSNNIVPVAENEDLNRYSGNLQGSVEGQVGNVHNSRVEGTTGYYRNNQHRLETLSTVPIEYLNYAPVQKAVETFDEACFTNAYNTSARPTYIPSVDDIHFYLITSNGNVSVPFNEPETLVKHPSFDVNREVVVFVTGFPYNYLDKTDAFGEVLEAYRTRHTENVVVYDVGNNLNNLYRWAALDTRKTGELIAQSLVKLVRVVPYYNLHLVGHSTGAHVAGAAARYIYQTTGNRVPRITALDPSRVCYRLPNAIVGLQRGDANFVDAIHTSAFGLGTVQSVGDVDFYPNGPNTLVPGTNNVVSAHNQAMRYYAETVVPGGERNFMAVECNSIAHVQEDNNRVNHGRAVPLGYATPTNARGNYFLDVNAQKPYGKNYNSNTSGSNYQTNLSNTEYTQRTY